MRAWTASGACSLRRLPCIALWAGVVVLPFTKGGLLVLLTLVFHPVGWGIFFVLAALSSWLAARRADADPRSRETSALAQCLTVFMLVFFGPVVLLFCSVALRAAMS